MNSNIEMGFYNNLYYRYFSTDKPRATLLVIHGMQEHSGRYETLAHFFASKGYATLLYDQLGHGKSVQNEAELGFFTLKNPAEKLVNDALQMAQFLKSKHPNVPCFVLGHSMGSFVVRVLLNQHWQTFKGAVLVGTSGTVFGISLLKNILWLCNKLMPHRKIRLFEEMFRFLYNRTFKNDTPYTSTSWLSKSVSNREIFENDPLCGIAFACNGYYTLLCITEAATRFSWAKCIKRNYPLIFVSGSDDPVGDFSKGIKTTVQLLEKEGFTEVKLKIYQGMRHEILQEDIKEEVQAYIFDALEQKIKT